jgi:predicted metal-binding membrane protein
MAARADVRVARDRVPAAAVLVTAAAWVLSIGAAATGRGDLVGHDHLIEGGVPPLVAIGLFLLAWQVMLAAMMLPSSLGMLRAFGRLADAQAHPFGVRAAFVGAYVVVWTGFGLVAFAGDATLHAAVDASALLQRYQWAIGGLVLIGAGAFQFSRLKDRCLTECRTPVGFLMERYRPGAGAAFALGLFHGAYCVGCCWALMLVAFAVGVGSLLWMALLTTVMVLERTVSWGARAVRPVGVWLIVLGATVLVHLPGMPGALGPS